MASTTQAGAAVLEMPPDQKALTWERSSPVSTRRLALGGIRTGLLPLNGNKTKPSTAAAREGF